MLLVLTGQHAKFLAKFGVERVRGIPNYGQPTAFRRCVLGKGCNQYVALSLDGSPNLVDVRFTILRIREKVKYGTVVPDGVSRLVERGRQDIPFLPAHSRRVTSEALLRRVKRSFGQIENC